LLCGFGILGPDLFANQFATQTLAVHPSGLLDTPLLGLQIGVEQAASPSEPGIKWP
jgi:hypothetical protein